MTFKEYLTACEAFDNPEGDFVRDARDDGRMPAITSWAQLESHLVFSGACSEAVDAAKLVWRSYKQEVRHSHA